jgi:hypothetical protein
MSGNLPLILSDSQSQGIIEYHRAASRSMVNDWNMRDYLLTIDRLYQREVDQTTEHKRAQLANRYGDADKFQNVTIPVVLPQVESAVTYQSSVFLTGSPLFGVVAAPRFMDAALQMETIIDDQAVRGGWKREIMKFFRDGFKYNIAALHCPWERKITPAFETAVSATATNAKDAKVTEVIWEGNAVKHLDMYNTFFDRRVKPTEMHEKGEFAGFTEIMGRVALKQFIAGLPTKMNVTEAFASGLGTAGVNAGTVEGYSLPVINPNSSIKQDLNAGGFNWNSWAGLSKDAQRLQYKDIYQVTTLYGRIIPSDFGIKTPAPNTPQIWKFIIVNHCILIYAERQTNAHNYIPILFSQPLEDGLGYQTKSLAANVEPIQSITTALANATIAARRRALSDRTIYDPSRIDAKHINNPNPSAKIPVRPAAYGKNIAEAVYAFPFRDEQAGLINQDIGFFSALANMISGQNPVRQGQFVKGNKTKKEFSDVMDNANGRDQTTSILLEDQTFTPLKHIIKTNILQYQGGTSLYNREKAMEVKIDPVKLRQSIMEFKVSDGLTPTDKLIGADTMQVAIQVIGSSPQIASEYNLGPLFSYFMKTQNGVIAEFEKAPEQKAYEQALNTWQQTVMAVMEKGGENVDTSKLPPQPVPQDYGYDPAAASSPVSNASNPATSQSQQQAPNPGEAV